MDVSTRANRIWSICILSGLLVFGYMVGPSCLPQGFSVPAPTPGAPEWQAPAIVPLPLGSAVNVLGGNFMLTRTDMVVRTQVVPIVFSRTYNSATGAWTFGLLGMSYNGSTFTDATGAQYAASATGEIAGSAYVVIDSATIRTKAGRVYGFTSGALSSIGWLGQAFPKIAVSSTQIQQCTDASHCTTIATITQGANGPTAIADANGRQVVYAYASGLLSNAKTPKEVANNWAGEAYAYSGNLLTQVTTTEGLQIALDYNGSALAHLKQIGSGGTLTWSIGFVSGSSLATQLTDPLGNMTRYGWDSGYHLLSITDATQAVASFTWSGQRISKTVLPDGTTTSTNWGGGDSPGSTTDAAGNVTVYAYALNTVDPTAASYPLTSVSDQVGQILTRTYDSSGRIANSKNGAGEQSSSTWTATSEPASITDAAGIVTTFGAYDAHGNTASMTRGPSKIQSTYDALGRTTRTYQPTGPYPTAGAGIQLRAFDENDNVASLTTSQASTITIARDSRGQITSITRPYGGNASMSYDSFGRLISRCETVSGASQCTFFTHDADGRLLYRLLPNGMKTTYTYDAAGRTTQIQTSLSGTVQQTKTMTYTNGKLVSQTDSSYSGAETFTYDSAGRLSTRTYPGGESITYSYTKRSQVASETLFNPDGSTLRALAFTYEGANRLIETDDTGLLLVGTTIVNGRTDHTTWGNGLVRTNTYDATGGFYNGSTTTNGSTVVLQDKLTVTNVAFLTNTSDFAEIALTNSGSYSDAKTFQVYISKGDGNSAAWADGALAGVSDVADTNCTPLVCTSGNQESLTYDALGGFANRNLVNPSGTSQQDWDWNWNAEHNRLQSVVTDQYDPHPGTTIHSYTWDAAGYVTARDGQAISFSAAGKVTQIGAGSASWDLDGRPVNINLPGYSKGFRYGGMVEMASGAPDVLLIAGVRVHLNSAVRRYLHVDFRGNVDAVFDESGAMIAHTVYGGFGSRSTTGDAENVRHFAQGIEVGDLELLGARLYDESAAMFLQPDPVYDVLSQYSYARNEPVSLGDFTGQYAAAWVTGAGVGLSAVAAGIFFIAIAPVGLPVLGVGTLSYVILAALGTSAVMDLGWDAAVHAEAAFHIDGWQAQQAQFDAAQGFIHDLLGPAPPPPPAPPAPSAPSAPSGARMGEGGGNWGVNHGDSIWPDDPFDDTDDEDDANNTGGGGGSWGGGGGGGGGGGVGGGGSGCGLLGIEPLVALWVIRRVRRIGR
jgi:RHS repeat-associated protein